MLQSMTGYGKSTGSYKDKKLTIEIRALNSKQVDMNFRVPTVYREIEADMRKIVSKELERGKIDVSFHLEETGGAQSVSVNKVLAKSYYEDLKSVNEMIGEKSQDYLAMIIRMPDVLSTEKSDLEEEEKAWVYDLLKTATARLTEFRTQEGAALAKEFVAHIEAIRGLLNNIDQYEPERVETIRQRLLSQLEEIDNNSHDENRLEQELIYYLEKFDVSEEKQRLGNHLDYFIETLGKKSTGRKLGFISQEIGREVNTLGSKSNHAMMQKKVVEMKDNLEKIKEQVLNTL